MVINQKAHAVRAEAAAAKIKTTSKASGTLRDFEAWGESELSARYATSPMQRAKRVKPSGMSQRYDVRFMRSCVSEYRRLGESDVLGSL